MAKNLLALVGALLDSFEAQCEADCDFLQKIDGKCDGYISSCLEDTMKGLKCLGVLLVPTIGWKGTSIEDCLDVINDDDTSSFRGTVKMHLTGEFWESKIDQILKAGSGNLAKLQSKIDRLVKELKDSKEPSFPRALQELQLEYKSMASTARQGQLKELDQLYLKISVACGHRIIACETVEGISQSDVRAVAFGLEMFAKESGTVELKKQLGKWEAKMASHLKQKHLQETLDALAALPDDDDLISSLDRLHLALRDVEPSAEGLPDVSDSGFKILWRMMHRWEAGG